MLQQHGLGCRIGSIYCGCPTVADDICLASNCPYELQCMLQIQKNHAKKEKYVISETKSTVLSINSKESEEFILNGTTLKQADSVVHLGITRENQSKFGTSTIVQERICTARRATYAMMGAGLYGVNGINPTASLHLIRTYIVPRLLYGLEATHILQKDIADISLYDKRLLKQIQHLPDKTADAAVYLMLGEPPIQAEIHRRLFTIFGSITRNYESVENQLAWRQLSVKTNSSHSWFIMVKSLVERYSLPSIYDLL